MRWGPRRAARTGRGGRPGEASPPPPTPGPDAARRSRPARDRLGRRMARSLPPPAVPPAPPAVPVRLPRPAGGPGPPVARRLRGRWRAARAARCAAAASAPARRAHGAQRVGGPADPAVGPARAVVRAGRVVGRAGLLRGGCGAGRPFRRAQGFAGAAAGRPGPVCVAVPPLRLPSWPGPPGGRSGMGRGAWRLEGLPAPGVRAPARACAGRACACRHLARPLGGVARAGRACRSRRGGLPPGRAGGPAGRACRAGLPGGPAGRAIGPPALRMTSGIPAGRLPSGGPPGAAGRLRAASVARRACCSGTPRRPGLTEMPVRRGAPGWPGGLRAVPMGGTASVALRQRNPMAANFNLNFGSGRRGLGPSRRRSRDGRATYSVHRDRRKLLQWAGCSFGGTESCGSHDARYPGPGAGSARDSALKSSPITLSIPRP